ncbi:DUF1028 domain-containing protein [Gordonia desulfuricans]|uniref:DUF1028 domain-containing protein n=1 Tax=Gordonia desulfuricans TaxID=89051 RepID=A0A7K3LIZ4_9ACTN|nr:DUF1028 domain-containing protein [Gordonia desulfuricans]NDK88168.1 DUF1028 domain-containing protein [Gordonia desulfuricans]
MTYSIVARDDRAGQLAVACESHFFAPGASVTLARAGVGVIATQAFVNGTYGVQGLARLPHAPAQTVLEELLALDDAPGVRQVAMLGVTGDAASWTGQSCIEAAGSIVDGPLAVQGNMLRSADVLPAMVAAFHSCDGDLADRVMAAMAAAEAAGGDLRGSQGASLVVVDVDDGNRPWERVVVDLRVDDHPDPIEELRRLLRLRRAFDSVSSTMFAPGLMVGPYREPAPGDLDTALTDLARAAEVLAPSAEPLFWSGVLAARAGRLERGRADLARAIELNPDLEVFLGRVSAAGFLTSEELAALR